MTHTYDRGQMVRCRGAFTSRQLTAPEQREFRSSGALPVSVGVDPLIVRFKYENPDGDMATLIYGTDADVKKHAVGSYYVDVNANDNDTWTYRFESLGDNQGADEDRFFVKGEL